MITQLNQGPNFDALRHARPQLHVYGAPAPELAEWAQTAGVELKTFPYLQAAHAAGLQANAVCLVRSDGYVSAAMPQFNRNELEDVLV